MGGIENGLPDRAEASMVLEDFLTMPETKPASEFVDGKIFQKPMPQGKHSAIQSELTFAIDRPLKSLRIARAFLELRCTFGGRSIVPDITVFKSERIPRDADGTVANDFLLAPDWTIEILSPSQSQTKVVKNIVHCLQHGALMGWLIDPDERSVFVYSPDRELVILDESDELLLMPGFAAGLGLTVGELFGWLVK
jgi:Uma2 family endonuclease